MQHIIYYESICVILCSNLKSFATTFLWSPSTVCHVNILLNVHTPLPLYGSLTPASSHRSSPQPRCHRGLRSTTYRLISRCWRGRRPPQLLRWTAWMPTGPVGPTCAARPCTVAWSFVRPMRPWRPWGNEPPPSVWRARTAFWLATRHCWPAGANVVHGVRSSACMCIGASASCQVRWWWGRIKGPSPARCDGGVIKGPPPAR